MDIIKHKRYEDSDDDSDYGSSDIGLIEEEYNSKNEENNSHQSSSESIESIDDIYSIDDRDSDEKSQNRIKQSKRDFACDRPEVNVIYS